MISFRRPGFWARALGALLLCHALQTFAVDEVNQRLANVGVDLLPSLLAADRDIERKLSGDGDLKVLVLYRHDRDLAEQVRLALTELDAIRGLPVAIELVEAGNTKLDATELPAAIFVAERRLTDISAWATDAETQGRLLFSPYPEDIERGAAASVHVSDRILPAVNSLRLQRAGINLKSFFLRIAKVYER